MKIKDAITGLFRNRKPDPSPFASGKTADEIIAEYKRKNKAVIISPELLMHPDLNTTPPDVLLALTFNAARPMPSVVPEERKAKIKIAMDSAYQSVQAFYGSTAAGALIANGYAFLGYPYLSELAQIAEYRRPSEIIAKEMTRKWGELVSTDADDDKADKIKEIKAEMDRLKVKECFREATEQDGFFGRSQVLIDNSPATVDYDDPIYQKSLATPMYLKKETIKKGQKIKSLRVIEPIWTYPNFYEAANPLKPDFFKPTTWFVQGIEVHESRMLTFVSRQVPDLIKPAYAFGGLSLSQMAQPYVNNWLRARQSVSDMLYSYSLTILQTNLTVLTQEGGAGLLARVEALTKYRNNRGVVVADKDTETVSNVSTPLSTIDKLQAQAQEHMAAVTGIPLLILFGIEPSGLNASTDGGIRTFYAWVKANQEAVYAEHLKKLISIIQLSLFGEIDDSIIFKFYPLWELDEKSLAEKNKVEAETAGIYHGLASVDSEEIRKKIAGEEDSGFQGLDVNKVIVPPDDDEEEEKSFTNNKNET